MVTYKPVIGNCNRLLYISCLERKASILTLWDFKNRLTISCSDKPGRELSSEFGDNVYNMWIALIQLEEWSLSASSCIVHIRVISSPCPNPNITLMLYCTLLYSLSSMESENLHRMVVGCSLKVSIRVHHCVSVAWTPWRCELYKINFNEKRAITLLISENPMLTYLVTLELVSAIICLTFAGLICFLWAFKPPTVLKSN